MDGRKLFSTLRIALIAEETFRSFDGLLSVTLDQCDLTVEIGFFLRMELEANSAGASDAFQHR